MALARPGAVAALEPLTDILKAQHDDRRAARLADIQRRKDSGAPLDDDTRWPRVDELVRALQKSVQDRNTASLRAVLDQIGDATSSFIADPGEFRGPGEDAAAVSIAMRVLKARTFRDLSNDEHLALRRQLGAMKEVHASPEDEQARKRLAGAHEAVIAARRALVAAVLAEVEVDGAKEVINDDLLDLLERSGLLLHVYNACSAFQDLPWGKGETSGSRARATSRNTTAAPAPKELDKGGGATGAA